MWGAARNLDAESVRNLALYFASLPPRAANDGVPSLVGLGQTIYQEGMPEANIVACVVCHGPNGEGIRDIPRLGGLDYLSETAPGTVESGLSRRRGATDDQHCQQIVGRSD